MVVVVATVIFMLAGIDVIHVIHAIAILAVAVVVIAVITIMVVGIVGIVATVAVIAAAFAHFDRAKRQLDGRLHLFLASRALIKLFKARLAQYMTAIGCHKRNVLNVCESNV